MTEEKKGVSAWLRGIIDECEVDRMRSCTAIAEVFGIDCKHERTCRDCITRMMTTIADRIDLEMMENERLKKENDELKAELADWKGNAEGFQPDAYMKLPLDADGEPIRIGDVLYSSGNECRVVSITVKADEACVGVHTDEGVFLPSVNPKYLSRKKPEPADSWEKLEKDARKTACDYAPASRNEDGLTTCDGCPFQKSESCINEMTIDLVERAKKLAGIEEEARND